MRFWTIHIHDRLSPRLFIFMIDQVPSIHIQLKVFMNTCRASIAQFSPHIGLWPLGGRPESETVKPWSQESTPTSFFPCHHVQRSKVWSAPASAEPWPHARAHNAQRLAGCLIAHRLMTSWPATNADKTSTHQMPSGELRARRGALEARYHNRALDMNIQIWGVT